MGRCERCWRTAFGLLVALLFALTTTGVAQESNEPLLLCSPKTDDSLRRLIHVSENVYCGAEPKTEQAFAELRRIGVTTVICVDGSQPNLSAAAKHGLRYLHVPIGYDRIEQRDALAIVRAMRESKGPVFVHCHHGRQRGPAMAAIAAIADTHVDSHDAIAVLQFAGTSDSYQGLWRDVRRFKMPTDGRTLPQAAESAEVDPLVRQMAELDRTWDRILELSPQPSKDDKHLKQLESSTVQLVSTFHALRSHEAYQTEAFAADLQVARRLAGELRTAVTRQDQDETQRVISRMQSTCKRCHGRQRDH